MKRYLFLTCILATLVISAQAQDVSYKKTKINGKKVNTFDPMNYEPGFSVKMKNLEAPKPGGDSYRSFLMKVKAESAKRFPRKANGNTKTTTNDSDSLIKLRGLGMNRYIQSIDTLVPINPPGAPLDNTLAISNDGMLIGSVNSLIYAYDLEADSIVFDVNRQDYLEFGDFARPISTSAPFDPKLLYDPQEDRFILVFLTGRNPVNSGIIVGFSSTNDPRDEWYVYELSGNPLDNNTWTDYPAIAITDDELFITINLLRPNEPWQTGFAGSIIWQVNKYDGYKGEDDLNSGVYSDIRYKDRLIRNLNPIQGGKGLLGPNMYLLSNRNFDVQNDSIFLLEVTNTLDNPETDLVIKAGVSNEPYGAPPNGAQVNASPATDSTGFDTNDGRVLGGFLHNDRIQFVANTKDFETGNAAVYHGFIDSLHKEDIVVTGNVIADPELDFGYPNIAYTGKAGCDNEAIIGFNHTSATVFAGFSAIHYNNNNGYSPVVRLKDGLGYVDDITGPYERWGDYFGIQRVYDEPGKVWTAGFYGNNNQRSATWFSEIESPDSAIFEINVDTNILSLNDCDGELNISLKGGQEPYELTWNGQETSALSFPVNACDGDFVFLAKDKQGCTVSASAIFDQVNREFVLYPNPVDNNVSLNFELENDMMVKIRLYDTTGKLIAELLDQQVKKGKNFFTFSTLPLTKGVYIFSVIADDEEILTEQLVKQ